MKLFAGVTMVFSLKDQKGSLCKALHVFEVTQQIYCKLIHTVYLKLTTLSDPRNTTSVLVF